MATDPAARRALAAASGADRYRGAAPDAWQLGAGTLLLALGTAPLLLHLDAQVGLYAGVLLALAGVSVRWPRLQPNRWLLLLLTLAGGLNVLDTYHSLVGRDPGSALLLTMVALKRLETRTRRDLRVLALAFGFLVVVQFLFDESPLLAGWLLLMLLLATALLADLSAAAGAHRAAQWRASARLALVHLLQALPLALVLFFLFPRLDAPLWDLGLDQKRAVTGLKDWLEPGSIGELVVSGEDAFRVRFDRPPGMPTDAMYWRGPVLWRLDGQRWLPRHEIGEDRAVPAVEPPAAAPGAEPLRYTVVLEPTDQRWLFGLEMPVSIPDDARFTPDYQLVAEQPVDELRLYRMASAPDYRLRAPTPEERQAALALPAGVSERMRRLVADWRAGGAGAGEVVEHALAFFHREPFRYTLLPPELGGNPTDEFLFETRAGFCEHYAASFVVLMRLAGIPSRIVLGYLGGEHNPISGDYLVRQSDAHAWAEVWIAGEGWSRVDPTAAVDPARVEHDNQLGRLGSAAPVRFRVGETSLLGQAARGLRMVAGAFEAGWKHWVLGFSSAEQRQLLDWLGLGHLREYGLALLMSAAGSAVMLTWALALARRPRPRDPVQRCWQRFGRRLARLGLAPRHHEGPLDYRNRVVTVRPDLSAPVDAIVDAYLRLRYRPAAGDDPRTLCRRVRRFRPRRRRA